MFTQGYKSNSALEKLFNNNNEYNNVSNLFGAGSELHSGSDGLSDLFDTTSDSHKPTQNEIHNSQNDIQHNQKSSNLPLENALKQHYVYHIVPDCNFKLKFSSVNTYTHGNIRNSINKQEKIPVTFDLNDAKHIATKLLKDIDNRGHMSTEKRYPVFGVVILKLRLDNVTDQDLNIYTQTGKREYSALATDKDLVMYNAADIKRGLISKDAFKTAVLVSALYVNNYPEITKHLGFVLLNSFGMLSEDLEALSKIYDSSVTGVEYEFKNQMGGGLNEKELEKVYYKLYMKEKARYLERTGRK